jgi:hypothetical protein
MTPRKGEFEAAFARWARRVRGRLALRRALDGVVIGLGVGVVGAGAAWLGGQGPLRPWMAGAAVVGGGLGLVSARRRRLDDEGVALYLDARLGSHEAIATAIDPGAAASPGRATVVDQAVTALDRATKKQVKPRLFRAFHGAGLFASAGIVLVSLAPMPAVPAPPPAPPGAALVRLADVSTLEKVMRLDELSGRNPDQDKRLKGLSDDAKKLHAQLQTGIEKRQALADLAKLRDEVMAERLSLGDGEQRAGLESAIDKLGRNPELGAAAKALGDRDLTQFDDEMRKLANTREREDRDKAREALEEAARAASEAGAPDVAKALRDQAERLDARGKRADHLRELAKALGEGLSPEGKEALGQLGKTGKREDEQKLAESLEKALGELSAEERRRLAENLRKQMDAEGGDLDPGSKQELRELAKECDSPEGQRRLTEELKRLAKEPSASEESERQRALDGAQQEMGELEQRLGGGVPTPIAGPPNPPGGKGQPGNGATADKDESGGQPGPGRGGGPGDHKGQTGVVDGPGVRAKAAARMNPGRSLPGRMLGRTTGRAGETADAVGHGGLQVVGPEEVGSVERSRVPEEYREQVGRYFEP